MESFYSSGKGAKRRSGSLLSGATATTRSAASLPTAVLTGPHRLGPPPPSSPSARSSVPWRCASVSAESSIAI